MNTFLQECSLKLITRHGNNLGRVLVVLPAQRPVAYMKKQLGQQLPAPFILPAFTTINELIEQLCPYGIVSPVEAIFRFYEVYTAMEKENAEDFRKYFHWATTLLNDFNEVDRYLIEPETIFRDLRNIKEIENWSFNATELSEGQKSLLQTWDKTADYYKALHTHMLSQEFCTAGYAYRYVAENIHTLEKLLHYDKIYFIGFNALSAAEQKIISFLRENDRAEVYFDIDAYYYENPNHEAGLFFRRYFSTWLKKQKPVPVDLIAKEEKQINLYDVTGNSVQASLVFDEIRKLKAQGLDLDKTVIILADEGLLIPVLQNVPPDIAQVNVTMGWSLRYSSWFDFFALVFKIQEAHIRNKRKGSFFYKDIYAFVAHPIAGALFGLKYEEVVQYVESHNRYFVGMRDIAQWTNADNELLKACLNPWDNISGDMLNAFESLLNTYMDRLDETAGGYDFEKEVIFHFTHVIKRLKEIPGFAQHIHDISLAKNIFTRLCRTSSIALIGEPLAGLQLMGMLETRCLDYENVFILSLNEGHIPKIDQDNSFIPFDLKSLNKLPGRQEKEAVYAYYFYRLLQRSKNIFLFYNSQADTFNQHDKSRYILQLEKELPLLNPNAKITRYTHAPEINPVENKSISIKKDESVKEKLKEFFERGVSASAINTYLRCPLDFYFKYILGIRDEEEISDAAGHAELGNIIHLYLHKKYETVKGKSLEKESIPVWKKNLDTEIRQLVSEEFTEFDFTSGRNHLLLEVAKNYISRFLDAEMQYIQRIDKEGKKLEIIELETGIEAELKVPEFDAPVKLKGFIDRIDKTGNTYRIVDYKTGKVETKELDLLPVDMEAECFEKDKLLQLLFYHYLFGKQSSFSTIKDFKPGLILLRQPQSGFLPVQSELDPEKLNVFFETLMQKVIHQMMNDDIPFTHSESGKYCNFCS